MAKVTRAIGSQMTTSCKDCFIVVHLLEVATVMTGVKY